MAQVDMKRFHMGCGESLQIHLAPLAFSRSGLLRLMRGQRSRFISEALTAKKRDREESR